MTERKTLKVIEEDQPTLFALEDCGGNDEERIREQTYRLVGDEVLTEKLDPECWAKALAAGGVTKDSALSIYAQIRSEELTGKTTLKETKATALEVRRLAAGLSEVNPQTQIVWKKKFSLMWDFLFWQVLLSISGVGLFLALLAMGTDSRWWPGLMPLVVVSAFLQLLPVLFFGAGKVLVGRISYIQALGATAVVLITLGGYMGIQTMTEKRSPRWLQLALNKAVEHEETVESPLLSDEEF